MRYFPLFADLHSAFARANTTSTEWYVRPLLFRRIRIRATFGIISSCTCVCGATTGQLPPWHTCARSTAGNGNVLSAKSRIGGDSIRAMKVTLQQQIESESYTLLLLFPNSTPQNTTTEITIRLRTSFASSSYSSFSLTRLLQQLHRQCPPLIYVSSSSFC